MSVSLCILQVDVKNLKSNIWEFVSSKPNATPSVEPSQVQLDIDGERAQEADDDESKGSDEGKQEQAGVSFKETVETMAPHVPSSVTVPFYFICMLHLANERGLKLESNGELTDFTVSVDDTCAPLEEGAIPTPSSNSSLSTKVDTNVDSDVDM